MSLRSVFDSLINQAAPRHAAAGDIDARLKESKAAEVDLSGLLQGSAQTARAAAVPSLQAEPELRQRVVGKAPSTFDKPEISGTLADAVSRLAARRGEPMAPVAPTAGKSPVGDSGIEDIIAALAGERPIPQPAQQQVGAPASEPPSPASGEATVIEAPDDYAAIFGESTESAAEIAPAETPEAPSTQRKAPEPSAKPGSRQAPSTAVTGKPSSQTQRPKTESAIRSFRGKYQFLSNFYPVEVMYEGDVYPSVEHAYQAAKTSDLEARKPFMVGGAIKTAGEAKRAGRKLVMRSDFEAQKLDIMRELLEQKFSDRSALRRLLKETGDAYLEEGNTWGDDFWGVPAVGRGENHLGRLLMEIRDGVVDTRTEADLGKKATEETETTQDVTEAVVTTGGDVADSVTGEILPENPKKSTLADRLVDPSQMTVKQLIALMEANPASIPMVKRLEAAGKKRRSVLGWRPVQAAGASPEAAPEAAPEEAPDTGLINRVLSAFPNLVTKASGKIGKRVSEGGTRPGGMGARVTEIMAEWNDDRAEYIEDRRRSLIDDSTTGPVKEDTASFDPTGLDEELDADGREWRNETMSRSRGMIAHERIIREIRSFLRIGVMRLDTDQRDKKGNLTARSGTVNAAIDSTIQVLGLSGASRKMSIARLFEAYQIHRGISVDRHGNIMGSPAAQAVIFEAEFLRFLKELRDNVRQGRHPLYLAEYHASFAGVRRYPTLITKRLAEWFAASPAISMSPEQLIGESHQQWLRMLPTIEAIAEYDQQQQLRDMVDAEIAELGGYAERLGIVARSSESQISMSDSLDPDLLAGISDDQNMLLEIHADVTRRKIEAGRRMDRRKSRGDNDTRRTEREPETRFGKFVEKTFGHMTVSGAVKGTLTYARANATLGLAMLIPTSIVEGGMGVSIQSTGLGALRFASDPKAFFSSMRRDPDVSDRLLERVRDEDVVSAVENIVMLYVARGYDAIVDAAARGVDFSSREDVETEIALAAPWLVKKALDLGMQFMTMDHLYRKKRAHIFLEMLVHEYRRSARMAEKGQQLRGRTGVGITPENIEEWLTYSPDDFMRRVVLSPEGATALVYTSRTSINGIDPATQALRKMMENYVSEAALTLIFGLFPRFTLGSMMRIVPFSYSIVYILKRGPINAARMAMERAGALDQGSTEASNRAMLGGNDAFLAGLAQNLIVDAARGLHYMGLYLLIGLVFSLMGGLEPPDEEEKYGHLWYEYMPKDGKAFKENWYWTEIFGGVMPLVVAASVFPRDPKLATTIFLEGVWKKLEEGDFFTAALMMDAVKEFDRGYGMAQAQAEGYEGGAPSMGEYWAVLAAEKISLSISAGLYPAALRQFYQEHGFGTGESDYARSASTVYTGEVGSDGLPITKMTTWADYRKRRVALKSPFLGRLMNLQAGLQHENENIVQNGYMRNEMPFVVNTDAVNMYWRDRLIVRDENGEEKPYDKWTDEEAQERVNIIVRLLESRGASQLAADGVVIPYDARYYTAQYLWASKNAIENEWQDRRASGEWNVFYTYDRNRNWLMNQEKQNAAYIEKEAKKAEVQKLLDMLYSDEIPYSAAKYHRYETNYRPVYTWKEGTERAGEIAFEWDYFAHRDDIDVEWYASGDRKSGFLPFLTVQNPENTFNAETGVAWQTEDTDLEWIRQQLGDAEFTRGMFEGEVVIDQLTGDGRVGPGAPADAPWDDTRLLTGSRALVPARMPLIDKIPYISGGTTDLWTGDLGELGVLKPDQEPDDKSGGGWNSSGWSSGGGGYVPNIYSRPAYSINPDKPAVLYSKNPSYARFDYLRPRVATKGSREAYRREDF